MKQRNGILFIAMIIGGLSCSVITNTQITEIKNNPGSLTASKKTELSTSYFSSSTIKVFETSTSTKSITMPRTYTSTVQTNILKNLSSGRYIVYTRKESGNNAYYLYIVSETGEEEGMINEGGVEYRSYLSPNQRYIAYSIPNQVKIFDVEQEKSIRLPDNEACFSGVVDMSWNPDSNGLAIACNSNIIIISRTDGKKYGEISHDISPLIPLHYFYPKWSPDGQWIIYNILADSQGGVIQGPFITNTSCMTNPAGCGKSTKLLQNVDPMQELIEWTPSNHLAVLDWLKKRIRIFNAKSLSLIQTIIIPDTIGFVGSFSWSNDEEWIALGSENGLVIVSIKTGETKLISRNCYYVNFWYVVK